MQYEYSVDRNTQNMNDELIDLSQKAKRESYTRNKQHRNKCRKIYFVDGYRFDADEKNNTMTHFNFKKTNGKKKHFSCGGYGGRCSMCSFKNF